MTLPPAVGVILSSLVRDLDRLAIPPYSLAVYGPVLGNGFNVETDPIHVALVVENLSCQVLQTLSAPLGKASRQARLLLFLVETAEISRMADCFSVKLLQIHRQRMLLSGSDPFASLRIEPKHLRVRLEQELRNHLMRLRYAYVLGAGSPESLVHAIELCTRSLWSDCEAFLHLLGENSSTDFGDFLAMLSRRAGVPLELLQRVSVSVPLERASERFTELLSLVETLTRLIDGLETRCT